MRTLQSFEGELLKMEVPSFADARASEMLATYDADRSGGLNLNELRLLLVKNGLSANDAKRILEQYDLDMDGELNVGELGRAWAAEVRA